MFLVMKLVFACPKNRTIDSNQEEKLQGTKRNGCALYAFSNPPLPQSELATCKSTLDLKPAITTSLVSFLSVWVKGRCAFLSHWYLLNCLCYNNSLLENRRLAVGINGRRGTVAVVRRRFLSFCWTRHLPGDDNDEIITSGHETYLIGLLIGLQHRPRDGPLENSFFSYYANDNFLACTWRHGGHIIMRNLSDILAIVLYTKMTVVSREWKPRMSLHKK